MAEQVFYLIEVTDPALVGQWGRKEEEVTDTYATEEEAWAEQRRRRQMLRWAGTGCTYYRVSDTKPAPPDPTPLAPFDPAYAGEQLDEEEGVGYPGGGRWDDDA